MESILVGVGSFAVGDKSKVGHMPYIFGTIVVMAIISITLNFGTIVIFLFHLFDK